MIQGLSVLTDAAAVSVASIVVKVRPERLLHGTV